MQPLQSWNAKLRREAAGRQGQNIFINVVAVCVCPFYVVASVRVSFLFLSFFYRFKLYSTECKRSKPFCSSANVQRSAPYW